MAASETDRRTDPDSLSEIKRKLALRMGIAALMILALLGGLAVFDHMGASVENEVAAPQFTDPVPVAKKPVTQPVTPPETASTPPREEPKESVPESTAAPVDKSAPAAEPPARPEVAAQPVLPKASGSRSAPAAAAPPVTPARPVAPKAPAQAASPAAPAAAPVRSQPQEHVKPVPAPPRLFSGYALQAGVFADPRRAEELHARLTLEGIPSTIEARVQVGPFKNREEAEKARGKLKALGIDTVLLPPRGAQR